MCYSCRGDNLKGKEVSIETYDHIQYRAKPPDKAPNSSSKLKYDITLLEFNSPHEYQIANLKYDSRSPLARCREIYSAGFPYDADKLSIEKGHISQIYPTIPFDNGTQIPYETDPGEKDIQAGMSGGPIFLNDNNNIIVIGINATAAGAADPIYTYNNKLVPPKMVEKYDQANWGIPIYKILTTIPAAILTRYNSLPQGALLDFDRAIQLRPNYGAAYLHRGETRLLLGDKQGAISDLTSAINLFKEQGRIKLYDETQQQLDKNK